jgi:hypothetical protein
MHSIQQGFLLLLAYSLIFDTFPHSVAFDGRRLIAIYPILGGVFCGVGGWVLSPSGTTAEGH